MESRAAAGESSQSEVCATEKKGLAPRHAILLNALTQMMRQTLHSQEWLCY